MENIITTNEREFLFEQMTKLLSRFDYEYSTTAINKIIDTWCENKSTLIKAFKKHQNYVDGKFLIAFEQDHVREVDTYEIHNFTQYLRSIMGNDDIIQGLPENVRDFTMNYTQSMIPKVWELVYYNINFYTNRTIDEDTANNINWRLPEIKAHAGEKTTRVVNRICTYLGYNKHSEYNRMFAKYADALTPITIKRHTILSINPLDYLTMSFGNSWSSCHTIDKENYRDMPNGYEGAYSSGTISYMLDNCSMVFYTVSEKYNGTDFFLQDKINRQMYHYGEEKLVQGRLYPQNNDNDENGDYKQYRNLVQEIIANIFNIPNLWIKTASGINAYVDSNGTHYRDYHHFNSCNLSRIKDSNNEKWITIGHTPICINCGSKHEIEDNIDCCARGDWEYCEECGCRVYDDEAIWIDGCAYCESCVSYCDICCEYHLTDEVEYIRGAGRYGRYVCECCRDEHYTQCEECGEYFENEDIIFVESENVYVCEHCLQEHFVNCENCEEIIRRDNANYIIDEDGTHLWYCDDCYSELNEQDENDNKESEVA